MIARTLFELGLTALACVVLVVWQVLT